MCILVMIIGLSALSVSGLLLCALVCWCFVLHRWPERRPHLEWLAADDAEDERRPAVILRLEVGDEFPHDRRIVVLETAAERVGQQLLGDGALVLIALGEHRLAECLRTVDRLAVERTRQIA